MANLKIKVLKKPENDVDASPTKAFFVEMLTRDIELKDAVLDLLDNCLDGVIRTTEGSKTASQKKKPQNEKAPAKPYAGFHADIEFDRDYFRISDNCGGMSKGILENSAFRLGRPKLGVDRDTNLATVGLYGIGMKRAIFKIGRSCVVTTRHEDKAYQVIITPEWLQNDEEWHLPLQEVSPTGLQKGTSIEIRHLYPNVRNEFDKAKNKEFFEGFSSLVGTHYSYIFHKGFRVEINRTTPKPRDFNFRFDTLSKDEVRIAPYMFRGKIEDVDVELVVGLYRDVPSTSELESMDEGNGFRRENAGWTVICNDRVVLFNDTSHVTGWGEAKVPKYHTQFVAITGVVRFASNNPSLLPLTTTKRGINQNSILYSQVKNVMREGLKHFTDFTNKWKVDPKGRREVYKESVPVDPWKAMSLIKQKDWTKSRRFGGELFVPKLPLPGVKSQNNRTISFVRPIEEIRMLGNFLFEDPEIHPSRIGEKCFDDYLTVAQKEQG
jgi:hypothetical protein